MITIELVTTESGGKALVEALLDARDFVNDIVVQEAVAMAVDEREALLAFSDVMVDLIQQLQAQGITQMKLDTNPRPVL